MKTQIAVLHHLQAVLVMYHQKATSEHKKMLFIKLEKKAN